MDESLPLAAELRDGEGGMHRIGVSFFSSAGADEVRQRYIRPVAAELNENHLGHWTNHLIEENTRSEEEAAASDVDEGVHSHLIVFQIFDFKEGVNFLRSAFDRLDSPTATSFQDMSGSSPLY